MRILLIEDDPISAKTVVNALTSDGHFCDVVTSAQDYNNNMVSSNGDYYDLVILDIHLPGDIDGYDILLRLRSAKIKVPVLILSCMSAVNQKAKGLGYGADDYLTKPFHKSELLARIKAIVRRTKGHPESVIKIGNININFDHRIVEVQGKTVHLTNKEYSMIELLALRKGTVLTKEMFLNHLYNGLDEPSDNKIVDVFMCKLRKKLESANNGKSHIETVWGRGYVLKEYIDDEEFSNADADENSSGYQAEQVKDNA
ncbi:response regulator transcription factor [Wolbachia endosymbiont of Folsomia candida]|uniref:response regulator transcription factor n=1 Tax=Wolbachia endosymbiont of Folsomia candida TaxID=169402 RepID=UPI000B085E8E|nr:response regulator transcription factor [Wolbachia endosymbiont of Folsomia candida]APR98423.1 DNA-binding response regulator [Wolbachia endosymbiont of Folsomia candida]